MARNKNALRGHFVQAYTSGEESPGGTWLELAKWISTIGDETEEETENTAYYDGDGTPETDIVSVAGAYSFEGSYAPDDDAQALIAGLKYKIGDGRKVWHRVVSADGKTEWVGRATVSGIVAGSGEASAYEEFKCTIRFDELPAETNTPAAPTGLEASDILATSLTLEWSAVGGSATYNVYQNGYKVKTPATNSQDFTGLVADTHYTFYVTAVVDGVESVKSNTITVTTPAV